MVSQFCGRQVITDTNYTHTHTTFRNSNTNSQIYIKKKQDIYIQIILIFNTQTKSCLTAPNNNNKIKHDKRFFFVQFYLISDFLSFFSLLFFHQIFNRKNPLLLLWIPIIFSHIKHLKFQNTKKLTQTNHYMYIYIKYISPSNSNFKIRFTGYYLYDTDRQRERCQWNFIELRLLRPRFVVNPNEGNTHRSIDATHQNCETINRLTRMRFK